MAENQVAIEISLSQLLDAVRQLSDAELDEFLIAILEMRNNPVTPSVVVNLPSAPEER